MESLTLKQKKIARLVQKDIPLTKFPFKKTGGTLKMSEEEILTTIKAFHAKGYMRKFGAVLRHQKAGYTENALVLWAVPEQLIGETGNVFASLSFISHCYERKPAFMNRYNIFTMLHAGGRSISSLIKDMVHLTGHKDYLILKSVKEYKKISPEYFR